MFAPLSDAAFAGPFLDPIARGGAGAIEGSGGGGVMVFIVVGALFYGGLSVLVNLSILVRGVVRMDKHQIGEGAKGLWRTFLVLAVLAAVVLTIGFMIGWLGSLFRH